MKISIVTPSFNSADYIRETILSIQDQSYKDVEHIVVDGLSTDATMSIVREYPHIRWISEKDSGQSNAINKGFRMTTGDILAWQNADDVYTPGAFEKVVSFFESNPHIDVVYGYYSEIASDGKWICNVYPVEWSKWLFAHGRFVPMQPTVFWRRRVFEHVGELDEKLHYCMDVDLFSRMIVAGFQFARIPMILGKFRIHSGSKTQSRVNTEKIRKEYKAVLAKNFNYGILDYAILKAYQIRASLTRRIKRNLLKDA